MKCISIYPQYVKQILEGIKKEEYRSWPTKYRGNILIACTKTKYNNPYILAIAEIIDCVKHDKYGYAFKLNNIRKIKPLPIKGQQRIYNVNYTEKDIICLNDDEKINDAYIKWLCI